MTHDPTNSDDRRLWEMFSRSLPIGSTFCPDLLDLAAWADGLDGEPQHVPDESAVAIEAHLADCAECRRAVIQLRLMPTETGRDSALDSVTERVVERARHLVEGPRSVVGTVHVRRNQFVIARRWAQWPAAMAASLVVCLLGYQAGTISAPPKAPTGNVLDEMTFGVLDGSSSDLLEMFALDPEEVTG